MPRLALAACLLLAALAAQAGPLQPWKTAATPSLALSDPSGALHRLADYRGKVVLVNFWATWCEPCRAEMPSLERLRESMQGRPFVVLAVNVGESPAAASAFSEKVGAHFTLLLDRDLRTTKSWGAKILPATFVVGPDGAIRYRRYGELDWMQDDVRSSIEALLASSGERAALH